MRTTPISNFSLPSRKNNSPLYLFLSVVGYYRSNDFSYDAIIIQYSEFMMVTINYSFKYLKMATEQEEKVTVEIMPSSDDQNDELIDIEEVMKRLRLKQAQAYVELKKHSIDGETQSGFGKKKFYRLSAIMRLAGARGAGSGLKPSDFEKEVMRGAGGALEIQNKQLMSLIGTKDVTIADLNKKLGVNEIKIEQFDKMEQELGKAKDTLDKQEKALFKYKLVDETKMQLRGHKQLLTGIIIVFVFLLWLVSAPAIAALVRPIITLFTSL